MELAFRILAVILAGIAAYFLWNASSESAFVSAVFGAVSFFLSVRFQVKNRLNERESEREREETAESWESPNALGEMPADEQVTANDERRTKDKVL